MKDVEVWVAVEVYRQARNRAYAYVTERDRAQLRPNKKEREREAGLCSENVREDDKVKAGHVVWVKAVVPVPEIPLGPKDVLGGAEE